jgi:hypothetical protein
MLPYRSFSRPRRSLRCAAKSTKFAHAHWVVGTCRTIRADKKIQWNVLFLFMSFSWLDGVVSMGTCFIIDGAAIGVTSLFLCWRRDLGSLTPVSGSVPPVQEFPTSFPSSGTCASCCMELAPSETERSRPSARECREISQWGAWFYQAE